ncbi:DNA polymerase zeta, partial [Mortierella sp. GBA35]
DDVRRRKANNLPSQEPPKTQIRELESIPWLNHDLNKRMVANLVKEMIERQSQEKTPTQGDFDNYRINDDPLADSLLTAYESVESLCPRITPESEESSRRQTQPHLSQDMSFMLDNSESLILVDESILQSQTAAQFVEDNIDTRKETFKGLAGLGAIEEQDDDDNFPLPDMDMDDFQEEDFLDEADVWDDFEHSDTDIPDPTSDDGPDEQTEDDYIPQFDGGGDLPQDKDKGKRRETDQDRWNNITMRRKRDRTASSSNLLIPSEQSPKAKRFRDLETTGGASKPVTPPMLTRQRSRTAGSSSTPSASSARLSPAKPSASLLKRLSTSTPASTLDGTNQRLPPDLLKALHGKYILDYVAIPEVDLKRPPHRAIERRVRISSPVKAVKPSPRVFEEVVDDPIEDFDDEVVEDPIEDIDDDEEGDDDFGVLPMDALLDDESDVGAPDSDPAYKASAGDSTAPVSPKQNYFLSTLDEVWSSPSPPSISGPDFFFSPPRPSSPDLIPAHTTPTKSKSTSSQRNSASFSTSMSMSQATPGKVRSSQRKRSSAAISDQSFINETVFPKASDLAELLEEEREVKREKREMLGEGHDSKAEPLHSLDKLSSEMLADDSILVNEIEAFTSPNEPSPSPPPTSRKQHSTPESKQDPLTSPQPPPLSQRIHTPTSPKDPLQSLNNPHLVQALTAAHGGALPSGMFQFCIPPPTAKALFASLPDLGLPNRVHQKPYFSIEADVPSKAKVFGGKEFRLQTKGIKYMPQFRGNYDLGRNFQPGEGYQFWEPNLRPPSYGETLAWLKEDEKRVKASFKSAADASTQQKREKISQIEGPTQKNLFGYKNSPTKVAASIAVEKDFLDVLSMEVHCRTRGGLLPDPKEDPILAVFYCWQTDREGLVSNGWAPGFHIGMITHRESGMLEKLALGSSGLNVHVADDEGAMLNTVIDLVTELDPDILAGYEVHNLSWGYLVDRYQAIFSMDMTKLISRIRPLKKPFLSKSAMEAQNSFNSRKNSGLKIVGRHVFNVWRLIRGEVALTNYGYCNVVFHVLQQRIPHFSFETLTKWWIDGSALHQSRVIKNYIHRVQYVLQLIESQELISRTSEFARVFGVDFFSVISRGSQYKVESLMVRLAKPENYIMISPSRAQVGAQRAAEVIPMIMEPESGFYEDPVVVLDFQSLYPSVMIAYNYCYSTCLGKLGGGTKLGVMTDYVVQDGILPLMQDHLQIAPNHVMYVNQEIRQSLLARMLSEILDTRVMVKKAMKEYPGNKSLLKLLDARQLSLKLIANVTYGYTCASFSGRMPGVEIADSIVLSARETLERAIRFVNENPKWNARVVYGDTDSMFVLLKGRTRQEAFEIGYDISETITRMNPRPVKLKFEKVYHPCFLVTKKRYVGSSYETPTQVEPIFDAKGIETIRRDGVPAVQKIMETCIKTMFRTQDLSLVKAYLVRQLGKILEGRVPVPDLMFGKEVKLGRYSEKGVPPPGAVVSARRMELDPRSEPQYGERVPYVVVYGDPSARLTDQVVEPKELLRNKDLRLNSEYYIRKHVIPSLERILQLAGADVKAWYDEMPRVQRAIPMTALGAAANSAANVVPNEQTAAVLAAQHHQSAPIAHEGDSLGQEGLPPGSETGTAATVGGMNEGEVGPLVGPIGPVGPPKFKPKRRRGGKGFVSVGSRIDRYYQSQCCMICGKLVVSKKTGSDVCAECSNEQGRVKSVFTMQNRLAKAEKLFRATVDICSSCCRAAPAGGAGVRPIEVGVGGGGGGAGGQSSLIGAGLGGGDATGKELVASSLILVTNDKFTATAPEGGPLPSPEKPEKPDGPSKNQRRKAKKQA